MAGAAGAIAGAALGPMLEPLVRGVWAELSESARQRQTDALFWAIRTGIPVDELEDRINASDRTQLLTAFALNAATRTAWEDKVRTLGRSLAAGLLADDNAKIDTEQMIIAAITDLEGPHLSMLDLLVRWAVVYELDVPTIAGSVNVASRQPVDIPRYSYGVGPGRKWNLHNRTWSTSEIDEARPSLAPIKLSLIGTLQRHGLAVQNGNTWSPTELGEQVFLRFRDAGADLDDVWSSGPAGQQE